MRTENNIVEQKELREQFIGNLEVLDKVKELVLLPYGDTMTTQMVADYYEVSKNTIDALIKDNKDEVDSDGYMVLTKDELTCFKQVCQIKSNAGKIGIFPRRAILRVGMLLRDSEVAKQIRTTLLDMSESKEAITEVVNTIDKKSQLLLNVIMAVGEIAHAEAIRQYNEHMEEIQSKLEEEKKVAVTKVENLTKSDATFKVREAKANLGLPEKLFVGYLLENGYMYRQHKSKDSKGNPTGRLKANQKWTCEPTRYFTDIVECDSRGLEFNTTVFTIDGIEYFRERIEDIKSFNK